MEEKHNTTLMNNNFESNIQGLNHSANSNMFYDNERIRSIMENFNIFGIASILYGIFFTFCLYKNTAGITLPLFALATCFYYYFCMLKLDLTFKKDSLFYVAGIILLSISTVLTDNSFFIFYNYMGMILLLITCLAHNFYEDRDYKLIHHLYSIVGTVFGSLGFVAYPFISLSRTLAKRSQKAGKARYVWYGILISFPLLILVINLLMSADAVFRNIFENIFEEIVIPSNVFGIVFMTLFGFVSCFAIISNLATGQNAPSIENKRTKEPVIAITFTSALTLVYLLFSFIQIFYLFIGNLELPDGYTYAGYAREGFFQLLFVCLINLAIVLFCNLFFRENNILKVILTIFCGCTFVMITSSAMRMILYIKAYRLSHDRVLVLWSLFVIFLLMICMVINTYKDDFPLFKYGVLIVSICYIVLSFSRPDTYIAKYNIEKGRMETTNGTVNMDYRYLFDELSADAIVVLEKEGLLASEDQSEDSENQNRSTYSSANYYRETYSRLKDMNIRSFNFSRYRALKIIEKYYNPEKE